MSAVNGTGLIEGPTRLPPESPHGEQTDRLGLHPAQLLQLEVRA
jgi:hypothetical protein